MYIANVERNIIFMIVPNQNASAVNTVRLQLNYIFKLHSIRGQCNKIYIFWFSNYNNLRTIYKYDWLLILLRIPLLTPSSVQAPFPTLSVIILSVFWDLSWYWSPSSVSLTKWYHKGEIEGAQWTCLCKSLGSKMRTPIPLWWSWVSNF